MATLTMDILSCHGHSHVQADSGAHGGRELLTKPRWQEIASSERLDLPQGPNGRGSIASAVSHLTLPLTSVLTLPTLYSPNPCPNPNSNPDSSPTNPIQPYTTLTLVLTLVLTLAPTLPLTLSRWVTWCSLSTSVSTLTTTASSPRKS